MNRPLSHERVNPDGAVPTEVSAVHTPGEGVRIIWTPPPAHERRGWTEIRGGRCHDLAAAQVLACVRYPLFVPHDALAWVHLIGAQELPWSYWLSAIAPDGDYGPWVPVLPEQA